MLVLAAVIDREDEKGKRWAFNARLQSNVLVMEWFALAGGALGDILRQPVAADETRPQAAVVHHPVLAVLCRLILHDPLVALVVKLCAHFFADGVLVVAALAGVQLCSRRGKDLRHAGLPVVHLVPASP